MTSCTLCVPYGGGSPTSHIISKPCVLLLLMAGAILSSFGTANGQIRFGDPIRLPEPINTEFIDFSSSISSDGLELYFSSTRPGGNFDTWMSTRGTVDEPFGEPEFAVVGNHPHLSDNGLSLFVNDGDGEYGSTDIFVYRRSSRLEPWGERVNLGPNINSDWRDREPSISKDGLTFYFTRTDPEQEETLPIELWVSSRSSTSDPFGPAKKLDAKFNDGSAFSPSISHDDLSLFSSVAGEDTIDGSADIRVSTRLSRTAPWSEPMDLGDVINTEDNEFGPDIARDGSTLFFSRGPRDVFGNWDLFQVPVQYPALGDFDGNGILDANDIDALLDGADPAVFDLTGDSQVNLDDRMFWVHDLKGTWIGDANLDGVFDSADFVEVFLAGQYEDDIPGNSTWATGDWTGDGEFNSSDFVFAFQDGGYEQGPFVVGPAVPEPSCGLLLGISVIILCWLRRGIV